MSRMFGVHPVLVCDKHTGSEWAEISQEAGTVNAGRIRTVLGHAQKFQFSFNHLEKRLDELQDERRSRGFNADNYTLPDREMHGYGKLVPSLTMQVMREKSREKQFCNCLDHSKALQRVEQRWQQVTQ